jgi:hypothetical protein
LRWQNLSAQASAQSQLSRSKQPQTHQRSNSEAVLSPTATARPTPQALCTPRGESASAERRGIHEKNKNMG